MKLVVAYIRTELAEELMHEFYDAGIGGITRSIDDARSVSQV